MSSESFVLKQIMKYAQCNNNYANVDYSLAYAGPLMIPVLKIN